MQTTDKLSDPQTLYWSEQDLVCTHVALEMARQHWRDSLLTDDGEPEVREMVAQLLRQADKVLTNIEPHIDRLRERNPPA